MQPFTFFRVSYFSTSLCEVSSLINFALVLIMDLRIDPKHPLYRNYLNHRFFELKVL